MVGQKEPKKDWILIIPNSAGVILRWIDFPNITLKEIDKNQNCSGSVFFVYPFEKHKQSQSVFTQKARYERASFSYIVHNLTIAPRGDPKDDQVGDEKDSTDTEGHASTWPPIDDTEHFENEADHMVGKARWIKQR